MGQGKSKQSDPKKRTTTDGATASKAPDNSRPPKKEDAVFVDGSKKTVSPKPVTSKTENGDCKQRHAQIKERTQWNQKGIEETVVVEGKKHYKLVLAAIDFGTHGSGFALGTRSGYKKDPTKIYCHTWNSGTTLTQKAPTSVLLKPDGTLHSFGYDAEREYSDLDSDQDRRNHYLFRQFKMRLFNDPTLSERTMLKDITDKEKPAVDVFATVIRFFKETLQEKLKLQGNDSGFNYNDVYWVITVPAIWNLKAKQFMRKAANKAGLKDDQLSLALEPEAASLYCRRVPVQIVTMSDGAKQIASLPEGSKYLVLDLGGGTIDITAHEVAEDGGLRELHQACGGYWGGTRVNEEFNTFLKRLVGADVIQKMKDENPGEWLDLLDEFEIKKCSFASEEREKITIRVPVSLIEGYYEVTQCHLSKVIGDGHFAKKVHLKKDKLSISAEMFEEFFQESIDNVVKYIRDLLDKPKVKGVGSMLAVGGYSESPLMINSLKKNFPNIRIVVPTDPSLAVLKGAVIYGYEPDTIASRVTSYTYGTATQKIWKEGDPEGKKSKYKTKRGLHLCDDVFDKHVEIGHVVKIGEFQPAKDYYPIRDDQRSAVLEFYASTEKDPKFIDDPNTELLGLFEFELTERQEGDDGKVLVRIGFGGTELEVEVKEASTGRIFKTFCNFLP